MWESEGGRGGGKGCCPHHSDITKKVYHKEMAEDISKSMFPREIPKMRAIRSTI